MNKKVSIIMASYNYAKYIGEAIDSVINQSYSNWELIIVDDGSTDDSLSIIKKYAENESRIKLYQHPNNRNLGLAKTLKLGLKYATSDWIVFLESDDFLTKNSLAKRAELIRNDYDLVFNNVELIGKSKRIEDYIYNLKKYNYLKEESYQIRDFSEKICETNIILTFSSVMVKRNLLLRCNFNTPVPQLLDHFLWVQLRNKKVFYINEKLTCWRMHDDSYINVANYTKLQKIIFKIILFWNSKQNSNFLLRLLLTANCIRKYFVTLKLKNGKFYIVSPWIEECRGK